jgi:hypothetical protein
MIQFKTKVNSATKTYCYPDGTLAIFKEEGDNDNDTVYYVIDLLQKRLMNIEEDEYESIKEQMEKGG